MGSILFLFHWKIPSAILRSTKEIKLIPNKVQTVTEMLHTAYRELDNDIKQTKEKKNCNSYDYLVTGLRFA